MDRVIFEKIFKDFIKARSLRYTDISYLAEGADHCVFSFKDGQQSKIVKIPKNVDLLPKIRKEMYLLKFLHSRCSDFTKMHIQNGILIENTDYPISICKKFEGCALDKRPQEWHYSDNDIKLMAYILADIHSSAKNVDEIAFLPLHSFGNPKAKFDKISPVLSKDEQFLFLHIFSYQANCTFSGEQVPLHYDLGAANLISDVTEKEIEGIIDFTNSCRGNFHCDLGRIRLMLNEDEKWNLFKKYYTSKSGRRIDDQTVLVCGFLQAFGEIYEKICKNDILQRINGAKNRTLFFANKIVQHQFMKKEIRISGEKEYD